MSRRSEHWRLVVIQRIPTVVIDYPLEVLLATYGVIAGTTQATGLATSNSLSHLLPGWMMLAYGAALLLGGLTIAVGLVRRQHSVLVAAGLRLLASAMLAYAFAVIATAGWRDGLPGGLALGSIAGWCYLRAFFLKTRALLLSKIDPRLLERP